MKAPSHRRWLARIGLVALGSLAALAATELAVRRFDPCGASYYRDFNRYVNEGIALPEDAAHPEGRLFENRPGADLALKTFRFAANAYGLRSAAPDAAFEVERAPGAAGAPWRLLFLGDSVTFAWGVDDRWSWVRTVEREANCGAERPIECLNAGHPHYDTVQEADWLAARGRALAPDAVVLTFVVNDLESSWVVFERLLAAEAEARAAADTFSAALGRFTVTWFRGLHGLWMLRAEERQLAARPPFARIEELPDYGVHWARCEAALERIRALCAEMRAPLVVLDHSVPPVADVAAWCARSGVPCYDFRFTDEESRTGLRNSRADAHANERGNVLLALEALAALRDAGVLAPEPGSAAE